MNKREWGILFWALALLTAFTLGALICVAGFEAYVRWYANQNYTVLGGDGLMGLMLLLAAEIACLIWLSREG